MFILDFLKEGRRYIRGGDGDEAVGEGDNEALLTGNSCDTALDAFIVAIDDTDHGAFAEKADAVGVDNLDVFALGTGGADEVDHLALGNGERRVLIV